ncbi:hypothetical protein [Yinghuangia soli]|uniref:Uncharacterized protein n=1 Tax=Yinghuangia soli TaxID=2908204 RepID=A0AA41Q5H5_9ACTN|nr:hypothetical protein [Yinghuangia soli]MCF2531006.1 hypothetical protein [Yinghuangia soli]
MDSENWGGIPTTNARLIGEWLQALRERGITPGVVTTASEWNTICGNSDRHSSCRLWDPTADGEPNFKNFTPFGGWTKPSMKTCTEGADLAGTVVDTLWWP